MKEATQHLFTLAKSTIVSAVVILVEITLIYLGERVSVPEVMSYAGVQIIGTSITFVLNKYWVFEVPTGSVFKQGAKAMCVFGGSLTLNTLLPSIGSYVLRVPPVPSFLASQVIVYLAWNFPLNRWWVFPHAMALDPSSSGTSSHPSA